MELKVWGWPWVRNLNPEPPNLRDCFGAEGFRALGLKV